MTIEEKVFKLVLTIPKGRVTTYKEIARILKINPRRIGTILHKNTNPDKIPCHRVVKSDGKLAAGYAFGGMKEQKRKLISEGIKFNKNKIDLSRFSFTFSGYNVA